MRKLTLLLAVLLLLPVTASLGQTPGVKGNGEVFFSETFGWENPADDKGWTAPEGYYFLDPTDTGFNWVWWPGDLGFVSVWTQDPPLQTTTQDNGMIALFLEGYNGGNVTTTNVDNSICFPTFDCSQHGSVVVRYETHFMAYSQAEMFLEISVDDWVHSASVNVNFGCSHKDRPADKGKGIPAIFEANISDVVAGQPNVKMRLHWQNTYLYYWAVDDFSLAEAYDYDLRIKFNAMEWDDGDPNSTMSWIYNIPKSQLDGTGGFMNFQSAANNFGEYDIEGVYMDLDIVKNGANIFHRATEPVDIPFLITDTATVADKYSPVDFGHYQVTWNFKSESEEGTPENNKIDAYFNVTDSVYSRADNSSELSWSMSKEAYTTEATENLNHFAGSIFPIFNDCEVQDISVFITGGKADDSLNYRFTLFKVPLGEEDETPYELLTTEMIQLDSAVFDTWVTMPLEKDGESEFLKKGDLVYAGIQFDNTNVNYLTRRNKGLEIGTDNSVKLVETCGIAIFDGNIRTGIGDYYGKRNFMIRLGLNDHTNPLDGVDNQLTTTILGQNYPNPFSGRTEIDYELSNGSEITFEVMDMTGRKVLTSHEGFKPAGRYTYTLNADALESGIYFYTIKAGDFTQTKQMVITQ